MTCPNCGTEFEDRRNCPNCGYGFRKPFIAADPWIVLVIVIMAALALPFGICGVIGIIGSVADSKSDYAFIGIIAAIVSAIPISICVGFIAAIRRVRREYPDNSHGALSTLGLVAVILSFPAWWITYIGLAPVLAGQGVIGKGEYIALAYAGLLTMVALCLFVLAHRAES